MAPCARPCWTVQAPDNGLTQQSTLVTQAYYDNTSCWGVACACSAASLQSMTARLNILNAGVTVACAVLRQAVQRQRSPSNQTHIPALGKTQEPKVSFNLAESL